MEIHMGKKYEADYLVSFVFEDNTEQSSAFQGKFLTLWADKSPLGQHTMTVGLGLMCEFDAKRARRAVSKGICAVKEMNVKEIAIDISPVLEKLGDEALGAIAESAYVSLYDFQKLNLDSVSPWEIQLSWNGVNGTSPIREALEQAEILAKMVCFARDLVNAPSNLLYPHSMAEKMKKIGGSAGLIVDILDEKQIEALGMEAFLTVGKGASNPPRLIVLRYNGNPKADKRIALVGKGVTCDTGGYCLKSASSMTGIKGDMAGGAAVFSCIAALAKSKVPVNVTAIIPSCENRISPDAYIPGDVINSMSGKKIEIGNTDAEGRLILADAVTYAIRNEHASYILDIATLTGAVVNLFGFTTAGVMSDNDELYDEFYKASEASCEQYWRLPIYPEYEKMIESKLADISNVSSDGCGTITAGLFIRSFAEGLPWIHIDIAGTAWTDPPRWEFQSKGATGAGVTTMYHFCKLLGEQYKI